MLLFTGVPIWSEDVGSSTHPQNCADPCRSRSQNRNSMPLVGVLSGSYDYRLVALSVLIAILASYAALDLGGRVTASRGRVQFTWLMGGSFAMGMGIWSMHYIGMLAY